MPLFFTIGTLQNPLNHTGSSLRASEAKLVQRWDSSSLCTILVPLSWISPTFWRLVYVKADRHGHWGHNQPSLGITSYLCAWVAAELRPHSSSCPWPPFWLTVHYILFHSSFLFRMIFCRHFGVTSRLRADISSSYWLCTLAHGKRSKPIFR